MKNVKKCTFNPNLCLIFEPYTMVLQRPQFEYVLVAVAVAVAGADQSAPTFRKV